MNGPRTRAGIDAVGKENARHQTQKKELGTGAVVANSRGASGSRVSRGWCGWAGLCRCRCQYYGQVPNLMTGVSRQKLRGAALRAGPGHTAS